MALISNNAATFDSQSAEVSILTELIKSSRVYAPAVKNHSKRVNATGSRIEWFDQNLGNGIVTLNGAYTAASGTMTFDVSSLAFPYQIKPGVHQVKTKNGGATYNILAFNATTGVASVQFAAGLGTDANIADNVELFLIRNAAIVDNASQQNDI